MSLLTLNHLHRRLDGGGEDGDVLIRKHAPQLKDMPFTLELVAKRNLSMHYRFRSPWELDSFRIGVAGRRPSPLCLKLLLPQVSRAQSRGSCCLATGPSPPLPQEPVSSGACTLSTQCLEAEHRKMQPAFLT